MLPVEQCTGSTAMNTPGMKVGELARRTGVSVRTLHWYEEVGLLRPTTRTETGHRLYGTADLARLQQIRSLQALGLSLEEIGRCLAREDFDPLALLAQHQQRVADQIARHRDLLERLQGLHRLLARAETVSAEDFLAAIEAMTMIEKYYTPEQLEQLKQRRETLGEERIREVEAEWPRLIAAVREEKAKGTPPADPRMQELATRWLGLVREFTGGDPGIARSVQRVWQEEKDVGQQFCLGGDMQELMAYVQEAAAARPAE